MPDERDDAGERNSVLPAVVLGVVVVVAAVVAGAALAQPTAPSGEAILDDAAHHYRSADTLTGVADVTVSNATGTRSATVNYAAARPHSARVAVTHNGTTATLGTNGTVAWVSAPAFGVKRTWNTGTKNASSWNATEACRAVRSRAVAVAANHTDGTGFGVSGLNATGPAATVPVAANPQMTNCGAVATKWADAKRTMPTNLSAANLTATRTGSETVDGTAAYVVTITPQNRSIDANATVWVAKNDSRVLEERVTYGENVTVVRYHDQHFNVSMDGSTFAPPTARADAGTGTYGDFGAGQDATGRDLPSLDAGGYAFETAAVTHTGGGTTVAQRYSNASTNATLVSTDSRSLPYDALNGTHTMVDGRNATVATMRGESVVAWTDNGTTYAVVTDGSTDEATALARTVST